MFPINAKSRIFCMQEAVNGKLKKKYIGKYSQKQGKTNVSSATPPISSAAITNSIKDIDMKLLENNDKILDSLNNLESEIRTKKEKEPQKNSICC